MTWSTGSSKKSRASDPRVEIENEVGHHWAGNGDWRSFRVTGYARCARCHHQFDIPNYGNFSTITEERIPAVVEEAKKWVRREAEQAGPCWGDVPRIPNREGWAVLDSVDP